MPAVRVFWRGALIVRCRTPNHQCRPGVQEGGPQTLLTVLEKDSKIDRRNQINKKERNTRFIIACFQRSFYDAYILIMWCCNKWKTILLTKTTSRVFPATLLCVWGFFLLIMTERISGWMNAGRFSNRRTACAGWRTKYSSSLLARS